MASQPGPSSSQAHRPSWQGKYVNEMSDEERLASLKEWAEEKKYTMPGANGTLATGIGGIESLAVGGPMPVVNDHERDGDKYQGQYPPIGPPSYKTATHEEPEKKKGPLKRWMEKRKTKKEDAKRRASAPPYVA